MILYWRQLLLPMRHKQGMCLPIACCHGVECLGLGEGIFVAWQCQDAEQQPVGRWTHASMEVNLDDVMLSA